MVAEKVNNANKMNIDLIIRFLFVCTDAASSVNTYYFVVNIKVTQRAQRGTQRTQRGTQKAQRK
jgi:hypothetical protein